MGKRRFSAEEKFQILEEGRAPGASIAEVCRRHQISSTLFYLWEKQAKKAALEVLRGNGNGRKRDHTAEQIIVKHGGKSLFITNDPAGALPKRKFTTPRAIPEAAWHSARRNRGHRC